MKVGIIGSGGREHALCHALYRSKKIKEIYCFPGNAGTAKLAKNIKIDFNDFERLKKFVISKKIDLILVGPEKPLVDGIVDFFEKNKIKIFGPNKIASQLEGSKIFTKKICEKYKIPTAKFGIFQSIEKANLFLNQNKFPIVVKADGLAAGKGVYICENKIEAENSIKEIFGGKFGLAKNILIEEFLEGEEMSYFIVSDGKTIKNFQTAQDHKRVLEGDKGKNTGGMGAYSPSRLINELLPEVSITLPRDLKLRKLPSELCNMLNSDTKSPFYNIIKRMSDEGKTAVITDSSIELMIQKSLRPLGILNQFKGIGNEQNDYESMCFKKDAFAIIDEVDSILIDEARTPLVISGQSNTSVEIYPKINSIVK